MATAADPLAAIEAALAAGTRSVPRQQLADMLGVHYDTVARWPIAKVRVGKLVYHDLAGVLAFLTRKHHAFPAAPAPKARTSREAVRILKAEGYDV